MSAAYFCLSTINAVLVVGAPAPNFSIIIAINALAAIRINACSFPPTLTILLDPLFTER
ncbi:hypothetical protein B0H16DRAFT_1709423 [Mycena metata]|uniref:Uncharacterized protein n=1 Tax=Mycena metata TaxID=1033252 RepID=A0AAD7KFT5_9AGAR|nr:hypothetical protein B0H16DRAFT_1745280 [Mycena metata]KAJ7784731.1 hypothetical protein B0H16DRAFT_1709423 [Mycena metata]